ncbi:MAG: sialate O-acetylesterase [Bacteroidetes bacterium]|nr:sialate O-acetylesterase [Bacteroidota bacterium]
MSDLKHKLQILKKGLSSNSLFLQSIIRERRITVTVVFLFLSLIANTQTQNLSSNPDQDKIRIACVGNSVTYGFGLKNPVTESYPAQLQKLLGDKYIVRNFGHSGTTLLKKGHRPYVLTDTYKNALAFKANIVIIHLGLNDTDPRNWPNYKDEFISDYTQLINSFTDNSGKKPHVFICRLTPIFNQHPRFKSGTREWYWQIQRAIETVAQHNDVKLIDFQKPLYNRPDIFADALHPNVEGASILAKTVYSTITSDFGGLKVPLVFNDHMVLQRNLEVPVWGVANAGEMITVKMGTATGQCKVNDDGSWRVLLPGLKAGGPFSMEISTNKGERKTIKDILIGEVWLCAGQSNMEFPFNRSASAKADLPMVENSMIRLFNLKGIKRPDAIKWDSASLEKVNRLEFFNAHWEICSAETVKDFSAIGYYFGKDIYRVLNVPIGVIQITVGGAPAEAFIDRKSLEFHPQLVEILSNWRKNDMIQDWCRERVDLNTALSHNPQQRHPFEPAYIFESGISMIAPFPIRGTIWYQGESNAHNLELHELILPALIQSWRNIWNNPQLPFLFAQLSSLSRPSWSSFRDSQRKLSESIPYCGMIVTSDLGDSLDVHPTRKKEIGKRFSLLALHNVYHQSVNASGPTLHKIKTNEDKIILTFSNARKLGTSDAKKLREFELAGADQIFRSVDAKIKGNKIIISITNQRYYWVRYGWKPFSRGNLINEDGLPASTFLSAIP